MGKGRKNGTKKYNENGATGSTTKNEKGNVNIVGRDMNVGRDLIQTVHNYPPAQPLPAPPPSTPEELKKIIER
uniref:Uncharacterized protein n=1 Tax=Plectus sambesii TaxID=2011161 RepID=A0A914VK58_9BILA